MNKNALCINIKYTSIANCNNLANFAYKTQLTELQHQHSFSNVNFILNFFDNARLNHYLCDVFLHKG